MDTALVIDAPYPILAPGGSIVCIASMTVHMLSPPLTAEAESRFATTPTSDLLSHPSGQEGESDQRGLAYYSLATRANQLCVHGVAHTFGQRGCRIDGVSPGVFYTAMVEQAPVSADGAIIRRLASSSAIGVAARGQMR